MSERLEELTARLGSAEPGARRVAVHDLIALGGAGARAALAGRLRLERDEKAALLIIRHLASAGATEAMPTLLGLYEDRATPVRVAHAAILAHDALAAV